MIIKGRSGGHFAVLAAAVLAACSGEEPPEEDEPRCLEVGAPAPPPSAGAARYVGAVGVVDVHVFTTDAAGAAVESSSGRITGTFADYRGAGSSTAADQLQLGERCRGVVSRSMAAMPVAVAIDELVVSGTPRGDVVVPATSPGKHIDIGDPLLDGTSTLVTRVTSSGAFPGFELSHDPALPLVMETPVSDGTGEVVRSGLRVKWNAGNGDAVVVVITPEMQQGGVQSGGQIVCEVIDDGCFDVPASATTFLLSSNVERYKMILSRVRVTAENVGADGYAELSSASEWRVDLKNGVFE